MKKSQLSVICNNYLNAKCFEKTTIQNASDMSLIDVGISIRNKLNLMLCQQILY